MPKAINSYTAVPEHFNANSMEIILVGVLNSLQPHKFKTLKLVKWFIRSVWSSALGVPSKAGPSEAGPSKAGPSEAGV